MSIAASTCTNARQGAVDFSQWFEAILRLPQRSQEQGAHYKHNDDIDMQPLE